METIKCTYCECKVRMADVEANDGACPECGAPLMGSMLFEKESTVDDQYQDDGAEELGFEDEHEDEPA